MAKWSSSGRTARATSPPCRSGRPWPRAFRVFAFDLLHRDGDDLRGRPLVERKAALADLLADPCTDDSYPIRYSSHIGSQGTAFFKLVRERGLEGIVCNRADSLYRSGRSKA
jgi:bifunctional non-homologous end joining protein LigD